MQNPKSGALTTFFAKEDKKWEKFANHDIAWAYCYLDDIYDKKSDKENSLRNYRKATDGDPEFTKFPETYIKFINDKKEKRERDLKNLELLNQTLIRLKEEQGGT